MALPARIAQTFSLTTLALLAFAANSLLCRMALHDDSIDAASFGSVRLAAGALTLAAVLRLRSTPAPALRPDFAAAAMLWAYVAAFTFAYRTLPTGTGALVLFGAVQLTMFSAGIRQGERFGAVAWAGFALACAGLAYLVSPGVQAPSLQGALLMATAGIAWGLYSLRGRSVADPLAATAANFARATPLALVLSLVFAWALDAPTHAAPRGLLLAVLSGALTSGLGYVAWYAVLPRLTALSAATVQLAVPPLAAVGGVLLLSEALSMRLVVASAATLGGIALVLMSRSARPRADLRAR